jgi:hypothetical protein
MIGASNENKYINYDIHNATIYTQYAAVPALIKLEYVPSTYGTPQFVNSIA